MMMMMNVTVRQLWRRGGLAHPGAVPAVIVTVHGSTVAVMFGPALHTVRGKQARDLLVICGTDCTFSEISGGKLKIILIGNVQEIYFGSHQYCRLIAHFVSESYLEA